MSRLATSTSPRQDFPSVFGDTSDIRLFGKLKEFLGKSDGREVFRIAYRWFYSSLETRHADVYFRTFTETDELPYYVKLLLFKFITEEDFSL